MQLIGGKRRLDGHMIGSDTHMSESEQEEQKIHEGTEALQDIAKDVEREREEHGTNKFEETEDEA